MKVCIVSCFDWYEKRLKYVSRVFENKGVEVMYVMSDFDHIEKQYVKKKGEIRYIHTKQYNKNLSVKRILSHIDFAYKVYKELEEMIPDYIYVLIPPNSILKAVAKYRRKHIRTKVFLDVIDMWPESMPFKRGNWIVYFFYKIWQGIREKNIQCADMVFTECNLYQEHLQNVVPTEKMRTLYIAKEVFGRKQIDNDEKQEGITLAYLGSINNILDIDRICSILTKLVQNKKVVVRIIGKGEKRETFIKKLEAIGIEVIDEGIIYDEMEKNKILCNCDFGLNIMKQEVYVGLTTKSIDYFSSGLPVLNSIKGDSEQLVEIYEAGLNVNRMSEETVLKKIVGLSAEEKKQLHINALRLFYDNFTPEIFMSRLEKSINDILKGGQFDV